MSMNINGMNVSQNSRPQADMQAMWYQPELQMGQNGIGGPEAQCFFPPRRPSDLTLPMPYPQNPIQELVTVVKELINLVRGLIGGITGGAAAGGQAAPTGATQGSSNAASASPTGNSQATSATEGGSKNGQIFEDLIKGVKKFLRPVLKEFDGGKAIWRGISGLFDSFKGIWGSIFK
ncbi:MAG: hypothetical protein QY326_00215 [Bdellovibrionota bacterium]|nr:MAG: hypothetical protein QY326_00215 [Bdellovibrionota bacterium]